MENKIEKKMIKIGRDISILLILALPAIVYYYLIIKHQSLIGVITLFLSVCYLYFVLELEKRRKILLNYYMIYNEIKEKKGIYKQQDNINNYKVLCDNMFKNELFNDIKD